MSQGNTSITNACIAYCLPYIWRQVGAFHTPLTETKEGGPGSALRPCYISTNSCQIGDFHSSNNPCLFHHFMQYSVIQQPQHAHRGLSLPLIFKRFHRGLSLPLIFKPEVRLTYSKKNAMDSQAVMSTKPALGFDFSMDNPSPTRPPPFLISIPLRGASPFFKGGVRVFGRSFVDRW